MGLLDWGKKYAGYALGGVGGMLPGVQNAAGNLYDSYFHADKPYQGVAGAADKAKGESQALGDKLWGQQMEGLGKGLGYYQGANQAYQNLANQGPGQLEQFYQQQLQGQANPYWDRRQQQADAGLNAQMAARGGYNSGGALAALGNQRGALEGERFAQMGQLAAGAQAAQQGRLGQTFQAGMGLGGAQAGLTSDFYGRGSQLYGQQGENAINAGLQGAAYRAQGQLADYGAAQGLLNTGLSFASMGAGGGFGGGGGAGGATAARGLGGAGLGYRSDAFGGRDPFGEAFGPRYR